MKQKITRAPWENCDGSDSLSQRKNGELACSKPTGVPIHDMIEQEAVMHLKRCVQQCTDRCEGNLRRSMAVQGEITSGGDPFIGSFYALNDDLTSSLCSICSF